MFWIIQMAIAILIVLVVIALFADIGGPIIYGLLVGLMRPGESLKGFLIRMVKVLLLLPVIIAGFSLMFYLWFMS